MITPPNTGLGKVAKSPRGLQLVRFKDALNVTCLVQSVTLAYSENGIGLAIGAEKASPKVQARDARAMGLNTSQKTGLVKYPVPEEVTFDTRAVLTREQVLLLVQHLKGWLANGKLEPMIPQRQDEREDEALAELSVRPPQLTEPKLNQERLDWYNSLDAEDKALVDRGRLTKKEVAMGVLYFEFTDRLEWNPLSASTSASSHIPLGRLWVKYEGVYDGRLVDHWLDTTGHRFGDMKTSVTHPITHWAIPPDDSPKLQDEVQNGG